MAFNSTFNSPVFYLQKINLVSLRRSTKMKIHSVSAKRMFFEELSGAKILKNAQKSERRTKLKELSWRHCQKVDFFDFFNPFVMFLAKESALKITKSCSVARIYQF